MNPDDEKRIAAKLAKTMAMLCVRNTHLETIHAGRTPITKTGDYSDVFVVDADGLRIPWMEVSHINERVSDLLCMTDLAHASQTKEHDNNDDIKQVTGRTAWRR